MTERLSALFCIGCGRVDVLEACVGDCNEGPLDLVPAKEYDGARSQIGTTAQHTDILRESLADLVAKMPGAECTNAKQLAGNSPCHTRTVGHAPVRRGGTYLAIATHPCPNGTDLLILWTQPAGY